MKKKTTKPISSARRKRRRPGVDFGHWSKMDYWSIDEGATLCVGVHPDATDDPEFQQTAVYDKFVKTKELATRAHGAGALKDKTPPSAFIEWAKRKGIRVPPALTKAVARASARTEMGEREKSNLLKIIIGMAVKRYEYSPSAPQSPAITAIEADLRILGLDVGSQTIRKRLKEAEELLDQNALTEAKHAKTAR